MSKKINKQKVYFSTNASSLCANIFKIKINLPMRGTKTCCWIARDFRISSFRCQKIRKTSANVVTIKVHFRNPNRKISKFQLRESDQETWGSQFKKINHWFPIKILFQIQIKAQAANLVKSEKVSLKINFQLGCCIAASDLIMG